MTSDGSDQVSHRVRFRPPGINRDEKVGRIFETAIDSLHGTTYYVEDEDGNKYQLGPGAILGPEETAL